MSYLLAIVRLVLLVLWLAISMPLIALAWKLQKYALRDAIIIGFYRVALRIFGVHVKMTGAVASVRPLMVVSNHVSYLDIPVLAACAPVRFTPKQEIAKWPVIGWGCRISDCVFIDRRPAHIQEASQHIRNALGRGAVVSLFPEATTGNGRHVLPFKSSFFALAEQPVNGVEIAVQPVAIRYRRIRRLPIDSTQWPHIAWYGDATLLPHVLKLLSMGRIDVEVVFLPPCSMSQQRSRKELAQECRNLIVDALEQPSLRA